MDVLFCQSCGMPMEKPEDYGRNRDGGKREYCPFCFKNGKFTEPRITVDEMIHKVVGIMARLNVMPESKAREMAGNFIPKLKRWQKK
ncbi:MAG: zinc ribbon domain-containing protein [Deltaproteobacteria bacterium]|nr:zinc ribbon domain-containing protein [Deltaproteobacteria bacterium]